ncbi:MAG: ribonuclease catalytic domain-containing protein, partial [Candidatus Desulfofervidus auxilii]|nr:ribonuclease catalytic domain-containing protein [Candidatus Desulfofervidus auxilii]
MLLNMEGSIVEYIEARKIISAFCLSQKDGKVHLLTSQNREVVLNKTRICLISRQKYPLDQPREEILSILKKEVEQRENLKKEIDVMALWELLAEDGGSYSPHFLAELYFSSNPSSTQESAIFRALFDENIHFKLKGNKLDVRSKEKVDEYLRQKAQQEEREKEIEEAANWLKSLWLGKSIPSPAKSKQYIQLLKEWCYWQEEAPQAKITKQILQRAGLNLKDHPFLLLCKLGIFSKHENLLLHRLSIPTMFSEESKLAMQNLLENKPDFSEGREDLTSLYTFTIDGPETKDFDDALSLNKENGNFVVGIHITDLTPFIKKDDVLEKEAQRRGTSLYLPDQRIPMFPEQIANQFASLKKGEIRPALSFFITLDENAHILNYQILPTIIQVDQHFTYDEVNSLLTKNKTLQTLFSLALKARAKRLEQGGMIIALPELVFFFSSDNIVDIKLRNPEQPGRILVAEFMILANYLAAMFMEKKGIPSIYRSQLPPRDRVMNGTSKDIFILYLQRRLLSQSQLKTRPAFHHVLGLDKYTSITSPLRRFLDLILQRQMVYYLQEGKPLYT